MAARIPKQGELARLQCIKNDADWWVMLITGTPTIDGDTVLGDLTEATFTGHDAQQLDSWDAPAIVAGKGVMTHPQLAWELTAGAGESITGYAVYDGAGKLIFVQLFDAPRVLAAVGDQLTIDHADLSFDVSLA